MTPAEQLKGLQLDNGWLVIDLAQRKPNATGGCFSVGYVVSHDDGRKGFLKAIDYAAAFRSRTPETLQGFLNAYVFEKKLCDKCAHLTRIARAIDGGTLHVRPSDPFSRVDYLIFELAEGDIRAHLDLQANLDLVFILRTLHNVATGLSQLHRAKIAHQDLKPSNVLVYAEQVGSKIADLGRAWDQNIPAPHDDYDFAGDPTYAPPEYWYGMVPTDSQERRFGCDLYHLGNLIVFFFAKTYAHTLIDHNLAPEHRNVLWGGTYAEVLPFVMAAFDVGLQQFASQVPRFLRAEMELFVRELCNPDLSRRGHRLNRGLNRFGLDRYISRFDKLAHDAKLQVTIALKRT